jgi:hypothetical protein
MTGCGFDCQPDDRAGLYRYTYDQKKGSCGVPPSRLDGWSMGGCDVVYDDGGDCETRTVYKCGDTIVHREIYQTSQYGDTWEGDAMVVTPTCGSVYYLDMARVAEW